MKIQKNRSSRLMNNYGRSYSSVLHECISVVFLFHEILEYVIVAFRSCEPYGRAAQIRFTLRRGTALDQKLYYVEITSACCAMQWRPTVLVDRVYLRALTQ